jgi:hypothetical protein
MLRLALQTPGGNRTELALAGGVLLLGRGREAGIRIRDPSLSRIHARIELGADGFWSVTDLGSRNGTRLHGDLLRGSAILAQGDVLHFGLVRAEVLAVAPPPELAGVPAPRPPARPRRPPLRVAILVACVLAAAVAILLQRPRSTGNAPPEEPTAATEAAPAARPVESPQAPSTGSPPDAEAPAGTDPVPAAAEKPEAAERPEAPEASPEADPLAPRTLRLKSGAVLRGVLLAAESDAAFLSLRERSDAAARRVPREEILDLDGSIVAFDPRAAFAARTARVRGPRDRRELLAWALRMGLADDARTVAAGVLAEDPDCEEAHRALGRIRYLGRWRDASELRAEDALDPLGALSGSPRIRARLRELHLLLLGDAWAEEDLRRALAEPLEKTVEELLARPETHRTFLAHHFPDADEPDSPARTLAADLAAGRLSWPAAMARLAALPPQRLTDPGGVLDRIHRGLLGRDPWDSGTRTQAARMVAGERAVVFGARGSSAAELAAILVRQPRFFQHVLRSEAQRFGAVFATGEELARAVLELAAEPRRLEDWRRRWILGS